MSTVFSDLQTALSEAIEHQRSNCSDEIRILIPDEIDVALIRQEAGLSQAKFAEQIGVSVATLRNWEQGRRVPDGPARVLLALLRKNPRIVAETLVFAE